MKTTIIDAILWLLACVLLFPILLVEGWWARKHVQRLPEASGLRSGCYGEGSPGIRLLGFGDSVIAGVGIGQIEESIGARLAYQLHQKSGQSVHWQVLGYNGITMAELSQRTAFVPSSSLPTLLLVSAGVNDVTSLTSLIRWQLSVMEFSAHFRSMDQYHLVFLGLPEMGKFTGLPQPLRAVLGLRAKMFDQILARTASALPHCSWIKTEVPDGDQMLASDGYHPSAKACLLWSEQLADSLIADWGENVQEFAL